MAKLIKTALETNPYNDAEDELRAVVEGEIPEEMQEWAEPELFQNEISTRAGLQRWLIGDPG